MEERKTEIGDLGRKWCTCLDSEITKSRCENLSRKSCCGWSVGILPHLLKRTSVKSYLVFPGLLLLSSSFGDMISVPF